MRWKRRVLPLGVIVAAAAMAVVGVRSLSLPDELWMCGATIDGRPGLTLVPRGATSTGLHPDECEVAEVAGAWADFLEKLGADWKPERQVFVSSGEGRLDANQLWHVRYVRRDVWDPAEGWDGRLLALLERPADAASDAALTEHLGRAWPSPLVRLRSVWYRVLARRGREGSEVRARRLLRVLRPGWIWERELDLTVLVDREPVFAALLDTLPPPRRGSTAAWIARQHPGNPDALRVLGSLCADTGGLGDDARTALLATAPAALAALVEALPRSAWAEAGAAVATRYAPAPDGAADALLAAYAFTCGQPQSAEAVAAAAALSLDAADRATFGYTVAKALDDDARAAWTAPDADWRALLAAWTDDRRTELRFDPDRRVWVVRSR